MYIGKRYVDLLLLQRLLSIKISHLNLTFGRVRLTRGNLLFPNIYMFLHYFI